MKSKTLTALAFAGTLALGACGGKVESILDGKEDQETLPLTGIVDRIHVDIKNKDVRLYLNVPMKGELLNSGVYRLAPEQWPNDTARVALRLDYNELVSFPGPLGVGDIVKFELESGFEKIVKFGVYDDQKSGPFYYLAQPRGGYEGSITSYEKTGAKK